MTAGHTELVDRLAGRFADGGLAGVRAHQEHASYPVNRYSARDIVIEVANSEDGRRRLRLEARGREWARGHGLPTPEILDVDPEGRWMVARHVEVIPVPDAAYVVSAVGVAKRIAALGDLPDNAAEASTWRAGRRNRVVRAFRVAIGGVPLRLWYATRRRLAELEHPYDVAHGDFYPRNVLAAPDGISVVDWEYVGRYPRHTDLARLWSTLADSSLREIVLAAVLNGASDEEKRRIGTLFLWHSLRLLGENLSAPARRRNLTTLNHARAMVPEARELASTLGAWPLA